MEAKCGGKGGKGRALWRPDDIHDDGISLPLPLHYQCSRHASCQVSYRVQRVRRWSMSRRKEVRVQEKGAFNGQSVSVCASMRLWPVEAAAGIKILWLTTTLSSWSWYGSRTKALSSRRDRMTLASEDGSKQKGEMISEALRWMTRGETVEMRG